MSGPDLRLSVVVACVEAGRSIDRCLSGLEAACAGVAAEILVVHADDVSLAERVRAGRPAVRLVAGRPGALVPELWAEGFRSSRGAVVAFFTGHTFAGPAWARALLRGTDAGYAGVGGALALGAGTGIVDWAVYLLRYSAFMPPPPPGDVPEIPGDNAAYDRAALERHRGSFAAGFWEVEFHRLIRAEGARLTFAPEATVEFGRSFTFGTILRHRFHHGRHFGGYRVTAEGVPPVRVVAAAPLVPAVLAARVLRRAWSRPGMVGRALIALPLVLTLGLAWAAGEGWGAWLARRGTAPQPVAA